jgi:hypothetical protein
MATTQDLICKVTLYKGNAKIITFDLNFLVLHGICDFVDRYFLSVDQNFYTNAEISHNGKVFLHKSLATSDTWLLQR